MTPIGFDPRGQPLVFGRDGRRYTADEIAAAEAAAVRGDPTAIAILAAIDADAGELRSRLADAARAGPVRGRRRGRR